MFSNEYPIFGTKEIRLKFHCKKCNELVEDVIDEIPAADLAAGDTHSKTLNSDVFTAICPRCGKEYTFSLGTSCCGGEIDCEDLDKDDVDIEIKEDN